MDKDNKFFDDMARMASSATSTFLGLKQEVENMVTQQMEKLMRKMDMVTREDFNLVREMVVKSRLEQEKLLKRIDALEAKLSTTSSAEKPASKPAKK